MTYPNGVVPEIIAEWQAHVTRLLDGAAAPILDITPVASGGLGHVAITGHTRFNKFLQIINRNAHLDLADTSPDSTLQPFQTS